MNPERIEQGGLLPRGSRVLCAVSGGADSMCLLALLWRRRADWGIEVTAAHYEHGLRGEESLRDAAFVEDWCREQGIPFVCGHGRAGDYARNKGLGLEEAARELRYAFLEETADRLGCDRIATAHNADDNAETLLMHLVRGSGAAGLRGIPERRGRIVRPLLGCTREEILACLTAWGVEHVEDSTNTLDDTARNLLRHRVIPVLRSMNPRFSEAAGRTAALLGQDEDALCREAKAFLRREQRGESLDAAALAALHPAVAARVLRLLFGTLERKHVEAVLDFCQCTEAGELTLPGLRLRRERGRLYWDGAEALPPLPERELVLGRWLEIPEAGVRVLAEERENGEEINGLFKTYCFKSAAVYGKMCITGRKSGDTLRPAGRGCTKRLKALFAEARYTRLERDRTLVIRDERGILAVCGLAVDERAVPAPGEKYLCLRTELIGERHE